MGDLLPIDVMEGNTDGRTCLRILVGIGSKLQDFELLDRIRFDTSDSVTLITDSSRSSQIVVSE